MKPKPKAKKAAKSTVSVDFETTPGVMTLSEVQAKNGQVSAFMNPALGLAWNTAAADEEVQLMPVSTPQNPFQQYHEHVFADIAKNMGLPSSFHAEADNRRLSRAPQKGPAVYPGLTARRRVVLELGFRGIGIGTTIVDKRGELLAIAEPGTERYDSVGGVHLAQMPLGHAIRKLIAGGAQFDLVVADLTGDRTVQAVGSFAPVPVLRPAGSRKLILRDAPIDVVPERILLRSAVLSAVESLLSPIGEALIRLPDSDFNKASADRLGAKLPSLWYIHGDRGRAVHLYLSRVLRPRLSLRSGTKLPDEIDRAGIRNSWIAAGGVYGGSIGNPYYWGIHDETVVEDDVPAHRYTAGQRDSFRRLLLTPCTNPAPKSTTSTSGRSLA